MTSTKDRCQYNKEYYAKHREQIKAKNKERAKKWREENPERIKMYKERERQSDAYKKRLEKMRELYNTEEYRAKRRAQYAAKHANDPMTPRRAAVIAKMNEMCKVPVEERREIKRRAEAKAQFEKDLRTEARQNNYQPFAIEQL